MGRATTCLGHDRRLDDVGRRPYQGELLINPSGAPDLFVSVMTILVFTIGSMLASFLGLTHSGQPESPVGYILVFVISLVSIAPVIAIPAIGLGFVWASIVRRIVPVDRSVPVGS